LDWLLAQGRSDASLYRPHIPKLLVITRCGCGCPTVDVASATTAKAGPSVIVADARGRSPEGVLVGVIVHIRDSEISELEVSDVGARLSSLPKPEARVPWAA
jgi:hypothetical protein